jgi:hypothetical protein
MVNDNIGRARAAISNEDVRHRTPRDSSCQHPGGRRRTLRDALRRLVPRELALAAVAGAALSMFVPAVAQAGPLPATLILSSYEFASGATLPGGLSGAVPLTGGSSVTLTAPEYQYELATPTAPASYWQFMFWDVNATVVTTETATFTAPTTGGAFEGTAWYLPICVVGACGGGAPQVTTWAFSLTKYEVLSGTPISSVTPVTSPPAWTSPSTAVSTATAVNIAALPFLGVHNKYISTPFSSWFVFGSPATVTVSGLGLQVDEGQSPYAIAFYKQFTAPSGPPSPCPGHPHCV